MNRFSDKVVIVTGGGSGIGRATVLAFAREGAVVMVADVAVDDGQKTLTTLHAAGGTGQFFEVDVSDPDTVSKLVESTREIFGKIDVYFSNAGIVDGLLPCLKTTNDMWSRVIGVNLSGCFYGARAAFPHLARTKGNIVVTASVASLGAMAGGAAYTASKAGVAGLVNQLACEFASAGVRVNGVAPGAVRTNIGRDMPDMPGMHEWIKTMTPLGRWAEPEEIAAPVLFLASADASFITGSLLRVDGGWRSK